jgi:hypothetical protein
VWEALGQDYLSLDLSAQQHEPRMFTLKIALFGIVQLVFAPLLLMQE